MVSEDRVLGFLEAEVLKNGNKLKRNEDGTAIPVGIQTYEANVKALIDLYALQKSQKINNFAHPRGPGVSAFLNLQKSAEAERILVTKSDRAKGTASDGYNLNEKNKACYV